MYVRTIRSLKKVKACYFVKKKNGRQRGLYPTRTAVETNNKHRPFCRYRSKRERERRKGILERT
jgi:hypothetical protein